MYLSLFSCVEAISYMGFVIYVDCSTHMIGKLYKKAVVSTYECSYVSNARPSYIAIVEGKSGLVYKAPEQWQEK